MSGAEGVLFDLLKKALGQAVAAAMKPAGGARTVDKPVRPGLPFRRRTPKSRLDAHDVQKMAASLAKRLEPLRRYELGALPDHEWEAAIVAVCDSVAASGPLDVDLLFRLDLNPARLVEHVLASSEAVRAGAQLSLAAQPVYKLLLELLSRHIVEYVTTLPQFAHLAHLHEMRRLREVENVVSGAGGTNAAAVALFERRYLDEVARKLDRIDLFGISLSQRSRRYTMSTAYISLALGEQTARRGTSGSGGTTGSRAGELTYEYARGQGLRVESALAGQQRVLLRGLAGSGKTTLLQWFALRAAQGDFGGELASWQGLMPFFLPLRQYVAARTLPAPEEFCAAVAPMVAREAPENWVRQRLSSGRAMVLVDGVDEIPETMREAVGLWLEELVSLFPTARYIVSSRPSAVDDGWLTDAGFAPFEVLPMSRADVGEFILRWHAAAKEGCDEDEVAVLDRCAHTLRDGVAAQPHLSRLATSPLLCALLCALHRDRRAHLPRDRHELYDAALDMLIYRRDQERDLDAPEGVALSTSAATALLQRVAYWMLRNGLSAVDRADLVEQVARTLESMPNVDAPAELVVRHLIGRTGLLREPVPGSVDFVHRTFQDYLAARAAVDDNDLGLLVNMAHDDRWHDVVIMAVPHARTAERSRLLDGLLNRGDDEPADSKRLHLLAAAGLELATEVEQSVIEGVRQRTARLVPPRSVGEGAALALAGDFVLGLLPPPGEVDEETAAACVRTAATVGGSVALSFLTRFAGETRPKVLQELAAGWHRFDPDDYADAVLRHVAPLPGVWLQVDGQPMLEALRHLPAVDSLSCTKIDDYAPLCALPAANVLQVEDLDKDELPMVAGLAGLRTLTLVNSPTVRDLTALRQTEVDTLEFWGAMPSILGGLSQVESLRTLYLHGMPRGVETLEQLLPAENLSVEHLDLTYPHFDPRLTGIECFPELRSLRLGRWPEDRDLERLAALPKLDTLLVRTDPPDPDLKLLEPLRRLESLELHGRFTGYFDLRPLSGLPRLRRLHLVGAGLTVPVTLQMGSLLEARPDLTVVLDGFRATSVPGHENRVRVVGEQGEGRGRHDGSAVP